MPTTIYGCRHCNTFIGITTGDEDGTAVRKKVTEHEKNCEEILRCPEGSSEPEVVGYRYSNRR
jgi:hypothetical protein